MIGGDLVVHLDVKGSVTGINGAGGGDFSRLGPATLTRAEAFAQIAADRRFAGLIRVACRSSGRFKLSTSQPASRTRALV